MALKDVLKQEFIGLFIEIVEAQNEANKGLKGKVIDETRNMLVIDNNGTQKQLIKKQVTIQVKIKEQTYKINGKLLVGRPEERITKKIKL